MPTSNPSRTLSTVDDGHTKDYFDAKLQEAATAAVFQLVAHWKELNPYDEDLQEKLVVWRDDFLTHLDKHNGASPKRCFALGGWDGHKPFVEITVRVERRP